MARASTVEEFNHYIKEVKRIYKRVKDYLFDIGYQKWARAHSTVNRTMIMTFNIAESVNSAIKEERDLPKHIMFQCLLFVKSSPTAARDIKSSNILLGRNFKPQVSDFVLAQIISICESYVSTILAGKFGFISPEYGQIMITETKGEIYSFGVVMLELVTGRAPTGQADVERDNLIGWVKWMVANGKEI
ncbi:leucine-rich repeat receptor protein kinase MSP1-like [Capsicum annuum]|uniref:leucine-rich repeat receptor protein kinase MSP1-like n=1 Tax=Capsicum annuum TaxID=4072 RepID=UPI001FB0891E|nr:leucine-rich repeat receptor protein kinase MSP1-like [Capsicum annuum]